MTQISESEKEYVDRAVRSVMLEMSDRMHCPVSLKDVSLAFNVGLRLGSCLGLDDRDEKVKEIINFIKIVGDDK